MTNWIVAQLGARMHYAVPRILHAAGALETLYTDICAGRWAEPLRRVPAGLVPGPLARLAGRIPNGVPRDRIRSFPLLGLEYSARRIAARTPSAYTAADLWAGNAFCLAILRAGLGEAGGVYAFNSAGLRLLGRARRLGLKTVVEQTLAPSAVVDELLAQERAAFPDWQPVEAADRNRMAFRARECGEWESADRIVCGSHFVRDGIRRAGGPVERAVVVPYGVDATAPPVLRERASRPLRVLTVGAVGLRKGTPYLLRAARLMNGAATFRLVGHVEVTPETARGMEETVELTGPAPRASIAHHLAWADVFLLPSICEGSATACYEALAAGLPVITTPNAGSVVRNGIDGFVVPIRDANAIAASLEGIRTNPDLLHGLSRNAALRAREFTVERYGERLLAALEGIGKPAGRLAAIGVTPAAAPEIAEPVAV
jgi:glycosyltransferase involved in cell wall biosynthesis